MYKDKDNSAIRSQLKEAVTFEPCAVEQTHSQCQSENPPV